jgi:nicotinamidase-related amidase
LIDYQPAMFQGVQSHDRLVTVNNVQILAKAAKLFKIPTVLTTVARDSFSGPFMPEVTSLFPDHDVIDRTSMNSWLDPNFRKAVAATGRKKFVIAGLWTEVCVAMPVIQALGEGWDVTVITDASGGVSVESHQVAIQRMIAAGANVMTWMALAGEWQRDWARTEHVEELTEIFIAHLGGSGVAYLWEQQLLNTPVENSAG